jgi:hypothetical protein
VFPNKHCRRSAPWHRFIRETVVPIPPQTASSCFAGQSHDGSPPAHFWAYI